MYNDFKLRSKRFFSRYQFYGKLKNLTKRNVNDFNLEEFLNEAQLVKIEWPKNQSKPTVGIVKDPSRKRISLKQTYWIKFQRFLMNNDIPYDFYKIYESDWLERCKKFDIIIWRNDSNPSMLEIARTKTFILENYLGKYCFPSSSDLFLYEDKVRQYFVLKSLGLPVCETFISNSKRECLEFIEKAQYPLVSKITAGAGSKGVIKIRSQKQAKRLISKVFAQGKKTYWSYLRQKDYVYFQPLLEDALFDLRVISVGNKFFGYYRMKPEKDFRASGAGLFSWGNIPNEVFSMAKDVMDKLGAITLAIDFIKSESTGKYYIIEASLFTGIRRILTPTLLMENDIPGYYEYTGKDFIFRNGKFWIQEFMVEEVLKNWIKHKSEKAP